MTVLASDGLEEAGVGDVAAVLDVLLPLGRHLAHQVPRRQHEVDLGVAERVQGRDPFDANRDRARGIKEGLARLAEVSILDQYS